jgi:hypothetical protein
LWSTTASKSTPSRYVLLEVMPVSRALDSFSICEYLFSQSVQVRAVWATGLHYSPFAGWS